MQAYFFIYIKRFNDLINLRKQLSQKMLVVLTP